MTITVVLVERAVFSKLNATVFFFSSAKFSSLVFCTGFCRCRAIGEQRGRVRASERARQKCLLKCQWCASPASHSPYCESRIRGQVIAKLELCVGMRLCGRETRDSSGRPKRVCTTFYLVALCHLISGRIYLFYFYDDKIGPLTVQNNNNVTCSIMLRLSVPESPMLNAAQKLKSLFRFGGVCACARVTSFNYWGLVKTKLTTCGNLNC